MKINYNVTGAERKSLVAAISQELNAPVKYLGMPTAAYEVGGYHIDKTGTITGGDNRELVADLCGLHGFKAISEKYDAPPLPEAGETPAFEDLELTGSEELGLGRERRDDWQGENGMQASDVPEPNDADHLSIVIPLDGFTPEKLDNLVKLVNAKAPLLKAALGTGELPIKQSDETLQFPWFWEEKFLTGDEVKAYSTLISLLCKTAKEKKRVTAKEKAVEGSPKYAMRCFLLSLGMVGDEYKISRRVLLSRLEGSSSWKNGKKPEVTENEVSE